MRVERDRFLVLVSAMAAGVSVVPACHDPPPPQAPQEPKVVVVVVPAQFGAPPVQTVAPPPPAPEPPPPPPAPVATVAKSPNPYEGTPIHAQACDPALNLQGAPPRCEIRPPGPTCESIGDTKQECPTLPKLLKPRVAQAAIECLNRRSGTKDICEFNVSSICAYEALQTACLDPSAKAACDGVMARCGSQPRSHYNKMLRDACEAGVSGIADAKRKKFISCISESCRFETCLTYL